MTEIIEIPFAGDENISAAIELDTDPLEGASCHFCGRTADNFHVPDEIWALVEPVLGQHQACFKCFRIAAWNAGIRPEMAWQVSL